MATTRRNRRTTSARTRQQSTRAQKRTRATSAPAASAGKPVIIVESPAKTRTLAKILGNAYTIEASMGHVRDLPKSQMGVDIENDFKPTYVPLPERRETLRRLQSIVKDAPAVYLATDPDREGEAIAWHIQQLLNLQNAQRIEFNEITANAVWRALQNPRAIDMNRVNAQQARRVLDRLVGYEVSPLLWRKTRGGRKPLSAGRVQTVAVRLIVEREREIRAFVPEEYWKITATLTPKKEHFPFDAELRQKGEEKIELKTEADAQAVLNDLQSATYIVESVEKRQRRRTPPPPFITSTLQQEASRKLGFSAKRTMQVAQQLYEGVELGEEGSVGLITYMRTDSVRLSQEALEMAREYIRAHYAPEYLPEKPRQYKTRSGAQDAHEAIRPTDVNRTPESVRPYLTPEQFRLYELIWKRFVASQMADAQLEVTSVNIRAKEYLFRASGTVVLFDGFLSLYKEGKDTPERDEEELPPLPVVQQGELLDLLKLTPSQHFTQPPPRYTEATLVKTLEQYGIGRPSTYATILSTIQERGYVVLENRTFKPTPLGEAVNDFLVKYFPDLFDVPFTAHMEAELDEIEEGRADWVQVVREFYQPFRQQMHAALNSDDRVQIPVVATERQCPTCGALMVLRTGRYGEFLACSRYPDCKTALPAGATGIRCPLCGVGEVVQRKSKKGRVFYDCSNRECQLLTWDKPTGDLCPQCRAPLVERIAKRTAVRQVLCSNAACTYRYEEPLEAEISDAPEEVAG
ncbi:MAG: type I DNA topoisomerase [Armatimonadota bacterium]|nr:type I DNA topoisomerase [Armatimonadota bacterium]